jgi:hypothetical protein
VLFEENNFQIIRKIESQNENFQQNNIDRYNVIPEYKTGIKIREDDLKHRICDDYELVIIRKDILEIRDTENQNINDKLKNMIYFIDSL